MNHELKALRSQTIDTAWALSQVELVPPGELMTGKASFTTLENTRKGGGGEVPHWQIFEVGENGLFWGKKCSIEHMSARKRRFCLVLQLKRTVLHSNLRGMYPRNVNLKFFYIFFWTDGLYSFLLRENLNISILGFLHHFPVGLFLPFFFQYKHPSNQVL